MGRASGETHYWAPKEQNLADRLISQAKGQGKRKERSFSALLLFRGQTKYGLVFYFKERGGENDTIKPRR